MSSNLESELLVWEVFDLPGNTTIPGALYGIAFVLYFLCARLLKSQIREPDRGRLARFTLAYISLVFFCSTAYMLLSSRIAQLAYVNHGGVPGGPFRFADSLNAGLTLVTIFDTLVEVLTMAVQIWRLWLIWSGTRYAAMVTVFPFLLFFAYVGLVVPFNGESGDIPDNILGRIITAVYAVLTTFTVVVTGLVIARLLVVRRRHIRVLELTPSPYLSIIAMLVESYALESVWSLCTAISHALRTPAYVLFVNNDSVIKVIAFFLIVYRVRSGRGWGRDTEQKLTSLQWNRDPQTATDGAGSVHSQAPTALVAEHGDHSASHPESAV